jgi:hypothetical protein
MADGVNYSLKGFDQYEQLLGDELRGERATVGKSLLDVQRDLKIKTSYIAAIEDCDLEVFSNLGFVAGYVRSYARYLGLDPVIVYERFCTESGFSNANSELALERKKSVKTSPRYYGSDSSWKPGVIGQAQTGNRTILDIVHNFIPVILVMFVLFGTCFGAIYVLKEVQKLDVVALEEFPDIFTDSPQGLTNSSLLDRSTDIYSSEELALPVFEPRDRAVSTLKPNLLTALENKKASMPFSYSVAPERVSIHNREDSFENTGRSYLRLLGPLVRTIPDVPEVKLLAMTPAWVRIKNEQGDVIFEKILQPRETYAISKNLFKGSLRSGNAQNVYFVIDKNVFGPLSTEKSVVKNVSLDPAVIQGDLVIAKSVGDKFLDYKESSVLVNTAEVTE